MVRTASHNSTSGTSYNYPGSLTINPNLPYLELQPVFQSKLPPFPTLVWPLAKQINQVEGYLVKGLSQVIYLVLLGTMILHCEPAPLQWGGHQWVLWVHRWGWITNEMHDRWRNASSVNTCKCPRTYLCLFDWKSTKVVVVLSCFEIWVLIGAVQNRT